MNRIRTTESKRVEILALRKQGLTYKAIALQTGVKQSTVTGIIRRALLKESSTTSQISNDDFFKLPEPTNDNQVAPISAVKIPAMVHVTGDPEIDGFIWLRQLIDTGDETLIAKAVDAYKSFNGNVKEVEKRYDNILYKLHPNKLIFGLNVFNIPRHAEQKLTNQKDTIFAKKHFNSIDEAFNYPPVKFVVTDAYEAVHGCEADIYSCTDTRFYKFFEASDHVPKTVDECLNELNFWQTIYTMLCVLGGETYYGEDIGARERYLWFKIASFKIPKKDRRKVWDAFLERHDESDVLDYETGKAIHENLMWGTRLDTKPIFNK